MSIASQPLPGAVAVEEHNDVDHSSVSLAVSTVILALRPKENETHPTLWLPLVRRLREPYKDQWALPGGPLKPTLSLEEAAGFTLAGKSELNANPRDTKDYPGGVWTLPPSNSHDAADAAKYKAIGESDRMTLKFVKR